MKFTLIITCWLKTYKICMGSKMCLTKKVMMNESIVFHFWYLVKNLFSLLIRLKMYYKWYCLFVNSDEWKKKMSSLIPFSGINTVNSIIFLNNKPFFTWISSGHSAPPLIGGLVTILYLKVAPVAYCVLHLFHSVTRHCSLTAKYNIVD